MTESGITLLVKTVFYVVSYFISLCIAILPEKWMPTNMLPQQGRIHGYPSRVRVGRGSDGEGHWGIWAGAVSSKRSKTPKK